MKRGLMGRVGLAAVVLGTLTQFGCGGGDSEHETEYVEGVVTLDDKPVPGATVTFAPVDDSQGVPATGITDENGKYKLTTIGGGTAGEAEAGTVAGEYYVGVKKSEFPKQVEDVNDPDYGKAPDPKKSNITYIVPKKYNNPRKSKLKITVEKGKKNDIPIELKSR